MRLLDGMVLLSSILAEVYMLYDFFDNSFEVREQFKGKRKIIPTIITIAIFWGVNSIGNTYINLFGLSVVLLLYSMVLFDVSFRIRLAYVFIVVLTMFGGEFLLMLLLEVPPRVLKISAVTNLADISWQIILTKILSYMILTIVKQLSINGKHRMPMKIFGLYICQPIISIIIMLTAYYGNLNATVTESFKASMTICFIVLLFSNILIFYAFNQYALQTTVNMEQKMTIWRQNAEGEYYAQIAEMNQRHSVLVHDISHYLRTIRELAKSKQNEKIVDIVQETIGEIKNTSAMVYCHNPVLNAILSEKKRIGEEKGIAMDFYVEPGINVDRISDKDMITMLGNLLSNAIRAAEECKTDAYVKIKMYMQNNGESCVVKIENPYEHRPIRRGTTFLTTKNERGIHGIGLKSVEEVAKKYQGFLLCDTEEQKFTAMLVLNVK